VDLNRISVSSTAQILFVYVTGQVEGSLAWQEQNIQRPFIAAHDAREMCMEMHKRTLSILGLYEFCKEGTPGSSGNITTPFPFRTSSFTY
jgi:hypothetical protein